MKQFIITQKDVSYSRWKILAASPQDALDKFKADDRNAACIATDFDGCERICSIRADDSTEVIHLEDDETIPKEAARE